MGFEFEDDRAAALQLPRVFVVFQRAVVGHVFQPGEEFLVLFGVGLFEMKKEIMRRALGVGTDKEEAK